MALIAQVNLDADALKKLQEILPANTSLADAAIWPDHEGRSIRELDPLHYVSIPENANGYDQRRDCPKRNCVVEALKWFSKALADGNAPVVERRVALRYVAHLVGDIHQPLHAGRPADSGGTAIAVSYQGRRTNLHFFWDTDLVEMDEGSEEELAKRLDASVGKAQRLKWQSGEPKDWTDESFKLAHAYAYKTGTSVELSDEYVAKARPIVRQRLVQAGIRLAWLLNNALK